jgi:hypothetical protein
MTQYDIWKAYLDATAPKPRLIVTPNAQYRRNRLAQFTPQRAVKYYAAATCVNDKLLAMVNDNARRDRVQAARDHGKTSAAVAAGGCAIVAATPLPAGGRPTAGPMALPYSRA